MGTITSVKSLKKYIETKILVHLRVIKKHNFEKEKLNIILKMRFCFHIQEMFLYGRFCLSVRVFLDHYILCANIIFESLHMFLFGFKLKSTNYDIF